MGNLQNKLISQTYDALIQTGTDAPVDGTLRPLQDGSGQTLPVEISTGAVNFTGTVTGIDTGVQSVVAGTNVTVDNTDPANPIVSAAGGGGGLINYDSYPWSVNAAGYGNTYARYTRPILGGPFWQAAIDQNANTAILSQMYAQPGLEINLFVNAFLDVVDNDTYELAIYDTWDNGGPKDKVFSTIVNVIGANGNQYVETAVSWIPTGNRYWFGMQTPTAGASKIGMFPRESTSNIFASYGGWGPSPVGVFSINSLFYNSGAFPAQFPVNQQWGHRDESNIALYKTV